jgi:hypothetical protein
MSLKLQVNPSIINHHLSSPISLLPASRSIQVVIERERAVGSDAYDSRFVRKYARYEGTNDVVLVTDEHLRVTGILRTRSNKTKGLYTRITLTK